MFLSISFFVCCILVFGMMLRSAWIDGPIRWTALWAFSGMCFVTLALATATDGYQPSEMSRVYMQGSCVVTAVLLVVTIIVWLVEPVQRCLRRIKAITGHY
jgi:phosphatidylglycerophosphate synthase